MYTVNDFEVFFWVQSIEFNDRKIVLKNVITQINSTNIYSRLFSRLALIEYKVGKVITVNLELRVYG